jgi:hypothetical protein
MKKEGFDQTRRDRDLNFKQVLKERRKADVLTWKPHQVPREPSRGTQDEGDAGEARGSCSFKKLK